MIITRFCLIMLFCFYIIAPSIVFSFDSIQTNNTLWGILSDDISIAAKEGLSFVSSPLNFTTEEWFYTAAVLGTTILTMTIDADVKKSIGYKSNNEAKNTFWKISTYYGEAAYAGIFSGAVYSFGLLTKNEDIRITGRLLLQAIAYSTSLAFITKYILGRHRPFYEDSPWKYSWFEIHRDTQSFPSGHSIVAFSLSTVFAERINNPFAKIILYGIASLTSISRIRHNQHWFSDVLFGSLMGFGAGFYVVQKEKQRYVKNFNMSTPYFNIYPDLKGIRLVFTF